MAHRKTRLFGLMAIEQAHVMSNAMTEPAALRSRGVSGVLVIALAAVPLLLPIPAGVALLAGIAVALTIGNPWARHTQRLAPRLLAASVVALGGAMDLRVVAGVGLRGLGYTAAGIALALLVGGWLGRRLGVKRDTSLLLCVGTAICGGSAIAAVAPVLGAKARDVSAAILVVFLLNGVALFAFPAIAHALHLAPRAFGLWAALAIHDTSSVVGAAASYGEEALHVATAAKLARALWIVPVTLVVARLRARENAADAPARSSRPARPWFIAGFVVVAALVTYVPALRPAGSLLASAAHRGLALTLFLIGLGLSRHGLRELGLRPLAQAIALWAVHASVSLAAIALGLVA